MTRPRLLYVVTRAMTARHLLAGQLAWRQARGFGGAVQELDGSNLRHVAYHPAPRDANRL